MLESFYQTHDYLVSHVKPPIRRMLMDEVNWDDRLIAIKGGRGVGKTDFLLGFAKEWQAKNPEKARQILYVNFNNFYFTQHTLYEFAGEFVKAGGRRLLLDQAFKYSNWSKELRDCYYHYPKLQIIFVASPVMRLIEGNQDIGNLVKMYNLRGFSFREYLSIKLQINLRSYKLEEILNNHEAIAEQIVARVHPLEHFGDYLEKGYYPMGFETNSFQDQLLKIMNMMLEIDVLLIKQIDVAYLGRLRTLLYMLMSEVPCGLNVTKLAEGISTSRATVMNYIKCLKDARLPNLLYADGKQFPMKPSRVYMQNPNLCFALPSRDITAKDVSETFFYSALHGTHKLNAIENASFWVDRKMRIDVCATMPKKEIFRYTAVADIEVGKNKLIPLWLFGFLY